jgi:hypothetical protein
MIQLPLVPNLYNLHYYELYTYGLEFRNYVTLYDYNIYIYIYTLNYIAYESLDHIHMNC